MIKLATNGGWLAGMALLHLLAVSAQADVVVTFDGAAPGTAIAYGTTYTESGLTITAFSHDAVIGDPLSVLGSNGVYFDSVFGTNEYLQFSMQDGSQFNLVSFVFATNGDYGNDCPRWIETSAGAFDCLPSLPGQGFNAAQSTRTFSGPLYSELDWFRVSSVYFATELDDIDVTVPEPGSWSLAAAGGMALVWLNRRNCPLLRALRRRVSARAREE